MSEFGNKKCIPCEEGSARLSSEEIKPYLSEIEGWSTINDNRIEKIFLFTNFKEAFGFVHKVGETAEAEGHHPDILLYGWNKVKLTLSTYAADGLTENDFILASKIDLLEMKK